ncbi:hypothetical protein HDU98_011001 [Podochytrium sp. JEL0797]|nr:hypothetical protein HDU98_011001 [Podochytrium sp. JEL0797]
MSPVQSTQVLAAEALHGTDADLKDLLDGKVMPPHESTGVPRYFFIGCNDCEEKPAKILKLDQSELLCHRNVAGLVNGFDAGLMGTLGYAVEQMEVPHIIVCGHYDCEALRQAPKRTDHCMPLAWFSQIQKIAAEHVDVLDSVSDPAERHRKLVEVNMVEQAKKVLGLECVRKRREETLEKFGVAVPRVHVLVHDEKTGGFTRLEV